MQKSIGTTATALQPTLFPREVPAGGAALVLLKKVQKKNQKAVYDYQWAKPSGRCANGLGLIHMFQ